MFKRFKNLTPTSVAALAVVTVTSFLMLCLLFGGATFADPKAAQSAGVVARAVGTLAQTFGAGLWVMLLLPWTWGVIVYFDERTPDLLMRFAGTVVLAVATSTLVGLFPHGGFWAGQVGAATAHALGGLSARFGGFGTALAWLIELSLLFASFVFATDWVFHSLRRAGRTAAQDAASIAVEPAAELRDDAAAPEPREFVVETPRAAVAAAAMDEVSRPSSDEAVTPDGWDESEDDGRMVLVAPSGYRGVEFLPPSDELAAPETLHVPSFEVHETPESPPTAAAETPFADEHFVTTGDAAYFVETPSDESAEDETQDAEDDETVAEAVQTLFEAVTTPDAAAPVGTIGFADGFDEGNPILDEFFAVDAGWPYAEEPAAPEAATRHVEIPAAPAVEEAAPAALESEPAFEDEQVSIDDVLVSRLPADAFDDVAPLAEQTVPDSVPETMPELPVAVAPPAVAEANVVGANVAEAETVEVVAAPTEPAPQLQLFAEPAAPEAHAGAAAAVATLPSVDLARLHAMELDPLFHDAVAAVLERERASAVVLQRQLGIGYARGIRILDQMTNAGLVGPDTPTGSRQIRVSKDAWKAFSS